MSSTNTIGKLSAAGLLAIWLFLSGCSSTPPSRFEQAQQASTQRGASAVVRESEQGGQFNKFFPAAEGEYKVVYSQEKKGFAQAKLKQNGKEVAVFTISDTINNPQAKDKFQQSTDKIGGYPAVSSGSKGTAVLAGLFQVKVISKDSSFTEKERESWLSKFDLSGLAALQ
ncbi:MAG: hypothetical protein GDA44_10790 [Prochloron sp. SP5CPC1]|nr:hypothetical protein [Candidatus Paraprochloron terpiosi SP5CPC1]